MFSIIIPTLNNIQYLKLCINSIEKNSRYKHELIPHVNIGNDGTENYLKSKNIKYTITNYNVGICEGMNKAAKKATFKYVIKVSCKAVKIKRLEVSSSFTAFA